MQCGQCWQRTIFHAHYFLQFIYFINSSYHNKQSMYFLNHIYRAEVTKRLQENYRYRSLHVSGIHVLINHRRTIKLTFIIIK